jgi:hypothetical protein
MFPAQERRVAPLGPKDQLSQILSIPSPALSRTSPHFQLEYIAEYARNLGCRALLVEKHYVDRDHIEDHSLFYSRSFFPYPNACRRVHFFRISADSLPNALRRLEDVAGTSGAKTAWNEFSRHSYIGFSVIKPLPGSPVGRTVLRHVETSGTGTDIREFSGVRRYTAHLGPIELSVVGLPFQQQDVGVSACATTALWSALHKVRDLEEIGSPTPAQITTLATQHSLPFGRPMPSDEGLSLDQMCQALQALRVAPSLLVVKDFADARAYVDTALRSAFAPVLILESAATPTTWHAVTAVGLRRRQPPPIPPGLVHDTSRTVAALYVHDDRIGPYQRVDVSRDRRTLVLTSHHTTDPLGPWSLRYVLVPLHSKIRISVSALREIAFEAIGLIGPQMARVAKSGISFTTWVARPSDYLGALVATGDISARAAARQLARRVSMPRYAGIVRVAAQGAGTIDLLVDTTSTMKNLQFLAVTHWGERSGADAATDLAARFDCRLVSAPK